MLKIAGIGGLTTVDSTIGVRAQKRASGDPITKANFFEFGIRFDLQDDVRFNDHYDPLEYYKLIGNDIRFMAIKEKTLLNFKENDTIAKENNKFMTVPRTLTRSDYTTLGFHLNERLNPTDGVTLSEAVALPATRLEESGGNVIMESQDRVMTVETNDSGTMDLHTVKAETHNGEAVHAVAKITVKNHGELNVYADNILGSE